MKKIVLVILCLLLAFYVGWPIWSAYRIHSALENNDTRTLESKVDFPSVRQSLKPAVSREVERALDRAAGRGGNLGQILGGALKQQLGPQLVETLLNGFVTPKNVGEIYSRRGDIREIVAERIGKNRKAKDSGAAQGEPPVEPEKDGAPAADTATPPADTAKPREKLSLANVKRIAITGPLAFEVGLARDKAASIPDITAQLGFKDFDWKLVGLVPTAR